MITKVYKLYASTVANAAASLIIQRRGAITAVKWASHQDGTADNSYADIELSFTPTIQNGTNDTVGAIDEIRYFNNAAAAGTVMYGVNQVTNGLAIPVNAGDRLYLNTAGNAALTSCFVYVAE